MVKLRFLGPGQHQADARAVKEGHAAGCEQQGETQRIPVKLNGAVQVVHVDGDLAEP
jgi:hypothetical protein